MALQMKVTPDWTFEVSIVRVPPSGIASLELTMRFMMTCSSWP